MSQIHLLSYNLSEKHNPDNPDARILSLLRHYLAHQSLRSNCYFICLLGSALFANANRPQNLMRQSLWKAT